MSTSAKIRALEAKRAEALKGARTINDKADAEGRDLSAEELATYEAHVADATSLKARIDRQAALEFQEAGLRPDGSVDIGGAKRIEVKDNVDDDPKLGFKSKMDFFSAVMRASRPGASRDQRLVFEAAAPSTYSGEGSGVDGGFLVPPEFSKEIFSIGAQEDSLLPQIDVTPVQGNSMVFPKDETTPWGTDGVRANWIGEAAAITPTKIKLGTGVLRLHKLAAICPVSDEMMADGAALASWLPQAIGKSIRWKGNDAILNGTGDGQPLGMFAAGGPSVQVSKDSGQAANTLTVGNIANMLGQLWSEGTPFWMFGRGLFPSLLQLTIGNVPAFLPVSSPITGKVGYTLFGYPCVISQHAPAFSSKGDLRLMDGSYYRAITKAGAGMETDTSMHLYFDAAAIAFRTIFRMDGQPKLAASITQNKDSGALSPFLQLQAR